MINNPITRLVDYPSIKKLAAALHKFDASQHGAAIMVGAGFSRSAARHVSGEKKMPLWDSFTKKLVSELNPNDTDFSFSDPLRVAEEYRAYFGQSALNDRIRSEIDNDAWRVGDLYQSLLQLPWSEIMTTNWDTLLERAANGVHGPYYTLVTKPTDLTWALSPRIVKLHGTIGVTDSFIAAQEDYRTYPEKFAPFVNFARQVFIENELCLLGFSGDDPNFLHWAGWVRDHLANHARKIYLVGALNLTAARRKHLESINIAPIDLWGAVNHIDDRDLMHRKATELFLQLMSDEGKSKVEPHKWMPQNLHSLEITEDDFSRRFNDAEYAAKMLKAQLDFLRKDRESYPGWLVCPPSLRNIIGSQINNPRPNPNNLAAMSVDDRTQLLYEIGWRKNITFEYIEPWLVDALFQVASQENSYCLSKRQQLEIALWLLKNSRWLDGDYPGGSQAIQNHISALTAILIKYAQYFPDSMAELAYHQALVARDKLNYPDLEKLEGQIVGEDSVWKFRRAALLMELGRFEEGRQQISDAYRDLQEFYRYSQNSISILSRVAWAYFLLRAATLFQSNDSIKKLPPVVKDWQCDSLLIVEDIKEVVGKTEEKYVKNKNPIEPLFNQGHYRDNSNQVEFSSETPSFLLLEGVARDVGIPLWSGANFMSVNLLAGTASRLVLAGGVGVELWDFTMALRAARSETDPSIKGIFTRIGVAKAAGDAVNTMISQIILAINFWQLKRSQGSNDQKGHSLSALRVLIEALARLVVRSTPEQAKEIFRLAIELGGRKEFHDVWLFEVFDSLITNSLKSIPKSGQKDLLPSALSFPLQGEVTAGAFPHWPNPIIDSINFRDAYPGLDVHIDRLIVLAASNGTSTSAALLRLLPLCRKKDFLTVGESNKLSTALWGRDPTYQKLPTISGLYPHAFLFFPTMNQDKVRLQISRHLYECEKTILTDTQKEIRSFPSPEINRAIMIFDGMANAAANVDVAMFPNHEQAVMIFDWLVDWRMLLKKDGDIYSLNSGEFVRLINSIGNALSYAIVPALNDGSKTVERFERLKAFHVEVDKSSAVIPAFLPFLAVVEGAADFLEGVISKSLRGRTWQEIGCAVVALEKWVDLAKDIRYLQFDRLVSKVVSKIESGRHVGLQHLLKFSGILLENKYLDDSQIKQLVSVVQEVFDANDYSIVDPGGEEAISASSLREVCVKLANKMLGLGHDECLQSLLEKARMDALPEVRFAVDSVGDD